MIYSFPAPRSSGTDTDVVFDIFPRCMKLLRAVGDEALQCYCEKNWEAAGGSDNIAGTEGVRLLGDCGKLFVNCSCGNCFHFSV